VDLLAAPHTKESKTFTEQELRPLSHSMHQPSAGIVKGVSGRI